MEKDLKIRHGYYRRCVYITPPEEELITLYKAVMFLEETRIIVIITNRPLSEWTQMGVDKHLTETFHKRLMASAQLIHQK